MHHPPGPELALDRAPDLLGTRAALSGRTEYLAEPLQFGDGTLGTLQELDGVHREVVCTSEDAARRSSMHPGLRLRSTGQTRRMSAGRRRPLRGISAACNDVEPCMRVRSLGPAALASCTHCLSRRRVLRVSIIHF